MHDILSLSLSLFLSFSLFLALRFENCDRNWYEAKIRCIIRGYLGLHPRDKLVTEIVETTGHSLEGYHHRVLPSKPLMLLQAYIIHA